MVRAPAAESEPTAESKEAKRMSRLRNRLVPKSTMSAMEQVNWAWTHPGLYATGSNMHGLVDPLHPGSGVGLRTAVPGLDGKLIKDAVFSETHAAAVDSQGSLYQWGTGFTGSMAPHQPLLTRTDAKITALAATTDYIVTLDKDSRVKVLRGTHSSEVTEKALEFEPKLGWRENVTSISAGANHLVVATSYGNVYTCALTTQGNDRSQLGHTAAPQPFTLRRLDSDRKFASVACGAHHTLLLTDDGEVFGCGANDFGQLAMGDFAKGTTTVTKPTPLASLWASGRFDATMARAEKIAAGAHASYVVTRSNDAVQLLACGNGINGQLGNGTLPHMQGRFTKIQALSDHQEFDSITQTRRPIAIRTLSAANDHVVAVRDNQTNVAEDKSGSSVSKTPVFGYDVMAWGGNANGECIPGRKHRFAEPVHLPPLFATKVDGKTESNNAVRLQAAPRQWVSANSFANVQQGSVSGKLLVEQAFVAGHDVTAAFLKPAN
ncbi:RCC1/BLIP-II protein [Linderina pennispora]|uniref:RCC1/BLIP-II protein n=1 Tax=Linderina pennispora TaxID=61395 RepID=A0A1Y1WC41_9FUNG|nr:RCC1/BLIP-II protein [Linderina pennispora]ORX70734.1 RCC1/BLIP-II protein [Linderina pennispora]